MSLTTKILFGLTILLNLIGDLLLWGNMKSGHFINGFAAIGFFVFAIHLMLLNRSKYLLYSLLILGVVIHKMGWYFKVMHWPGSSVMVTIGLVGVAATTYFLIRNSLQLKAKDARLYLFSFAIVNALQYFIPLLFTWMKISKKTIHLCTYSLYFPLFILAFLLLYKEKYTHEGEKNIILYFTLFAALSVVAIFVGSHS